MTDFETAYNSLNKQQKQAVDIIEGPVMVIAGPGTGKTQVLSLRIVNILNKTDTPADGILCLTFTNAGVRAMRERLLRYIGPTATKVKVSTFHAFALEMIEEFHELLGNSGVPTLLEDAGSVALFDELLTSRDWKYLRPRANPSMYFRDLKSTISLLKRDRVTPNAFRIFVSQDIDRIKNDPESISSRGETKGQMKKEAQAKIESLERTFELADFYESYEMLKKERNIIDYNDVLEFLVRIVETGDDAAATIRERYLYILVDEHQDSSGIQNEFLSAVWRHIEKPNLFVVGDDRQLIYGFGGASLAYFEGFKHAFGKAKLITLTENYRSTQVVLDAAETLLKSELADGKLTANTDGDHPIRLIECDYPRDEIMLAGIEIKEKIEQGKDPNDFAILVPKNHQVKAAMQTLRDMNIPVAAAQGLKLFELADTQAFLTILRTVSSPFDSIALSRTLLDPLTQISMLSVHSFLSNINPKKLTLTELLESKDEAIAAWGNALSGWIELSRTTDAYALIQTIGADALLVHSTDDETIRIRVEIIRTLLHLALSQSQKNGKIMLPDFLAFIDRLQEYDEDIPLAVFGAYNGVKVLTLHGSKGLEFDNVWIAHMDERSLMGSKRQAFSLPQSIADKQEEGNIDVAKRQLYVAMTRAKRHLTISYARQSYTGTDQQLASIILQLPETLFEKELQEHSEARLLETGAQTFVKREPRGEVDQSAHIAELVAEEYAKKKVSVTMLNNFFECPWKWYFRNLLQLPEPLTEPLHVGNVVHETIEYVLKGGHDAEGELFRTALIESRGDDVYAKRLVNQAQPIVESWQKKYAGELSQPFTVEQNFSYRDPDIAHLTITGKIDVVEEIISGEVRVTDWKTGSAKTKSEIEKTDEEGRMSSRLRQLAMYSYLIEGSTHGNTSATDSRLIYLEAKDGDKNAVQSRRITSEEVSLLKKDIMDYDQFVKDGSWMQRKCCAKTYGAGYVCEYCALAKKFGVLKY